ncbi:MAG: bifunctional phosphopantothenoylcysteine decarboxylase/phosphopantothenate--cysteine ligase CoaBC [Bacteroidetes bacterium]|nr:bifunctional phosphopantothenoylcysteine decarboxylase/phosphopantothenate--cysteine ligase CoaBC [Bacteroidota bacterium]
MRGKRIVLGVTGSIAAYKSALLVRLLVKAGAEVKVIMTPSASDFVTPLTLSVLSKNPVLTAFTDAESGQWNNHIDLGLWADALVIAPATANTLAAMADGVCDNLLLAVYLSARCPVFISPAMDLDMLKHPGTQANIAKLRTYGNHIIAPTDGELASGLSGEGRMEEPENIFSILDNFFHANLPLRGKRALVTAGSTYEAIDPVRFFGNRSSGTMGFALAESLANLGADVTLISGPTHLNVENRSIRLIRIESASEMHAECMKYFPEMEFTIMAAAVADYRPENPAGEKIKKKNDSLSVSLVATADILKEMGAKKKAGQTLIGFALETENETENAKSKLDKKNLDYIILNSLRDEGAGFNSDTNRVTIFGRNGTETVLSLKSKTDIAKEIINLLISSNPSQ